ncbi:MAG: YceI family protein [Nitrospirae bacterium]|jgi:polyisoprenoid-binding protein YceI|nr:YceI family protein [Nitrospirota bacterium]
MPKWVIDPDHSVAAFVIRHMMVANVRGQFNKINGIIHFDPNDINNASVEVSIDANGIYTGIQKRDDHLRSPDFFDVQKCPQITFKSKKVEAGVGTRFRVIGELTIHGITKTVALDVECTGPEKSPYDETTMGFSAITRLNREDFGMTWNVALGSGGIMVGKDVQINLDIEADLS